MHFEKKFTLKKISIKPATKQDTSNLLAYATLSFEDNQDRKFTIGGFTVWESNYEGYNVEVPSKPGFKFCWFEESLWRKMKKEIIKQYKYEQEIPVIEEDEE